MINKDDWEPIENPNNPLCGMSHDEVVSMLSGFGSMLRLVSSQTKEMCMAAIDQDVSNLRYVKEQTPEIVELALESDSSALVLLKEQTVDQCKQVLEMDPDAAKYIHASVLETML